MTRITFSKKYNKYYQMVIKGHSCFNMEGPDILCASISMITQACANYISKDHVEPAYKYEINEITGELCFRVNDVVRGMCNVQAAFEMTFDALLDLANNPEFKDYIEIEVIENVY